MPKRGSFKQRRTNEPKNEKGSVRLYLISTTSKRWVRDSGIVAYAVQTDPEQLSAVVVALET